MRHTIDEHDPPLLRRALPRPCPGDVHDVMVLETGLIARAHNFHRDPSRILTQNPSSTTRRILGPTQAEEQRDAEHGPGEAQCGEGTGARHGSYHNHLMTRAEMEQKLVEIVRREKNLPIESLAPEAQLADAGIDSLDALTILFAIEEEFKISIPDDRARAMKTFGDIADTVAAQLGIAG
jgi:acyl carrier protein